jgi:tetratricopeptide (TPR) repeat protein
MMSEVIQKSISLSLAALMLLALNSCTLFRTADKEPDEQVYMKYTELFHQAGIQRMLGNTDAAHDLYLKAAEVNPKADAAYYYSALLFYHKKKYQRALFNIDKALNIDSEHLWYNFLAASVHQKLGNYKSSKKYYKALTESHPELDFVYKDLIDLYLENNKLEDAAQVFKQYARSAEPDKDYALLIFRKLTSQPKLALDFVEYMRTVFADTVRFDMLQADLLIQIGDKTAAEDIYMRYYQKEKPDAKVLVTLYNYYYYADNGSIIKQLEQRIINSDAEPEIKLQIAQVQSKNDSVSYRETLRMLYSQYPNHPKINLLSGNFFYEQKDYEKAFAAFRTAYTTHKTGFLLSKKMLHTADMLADYESMRQYADTALSYLPNQPEIYLYAGKAAVYLRDAEIAKYHLETGRSLLFGNDSLFQKFDYCEALLDYLNKDYQEARVEFKRLSEQVNYSAKPNAMYCLTDIKLEPGNTESLQLLATLKTLLPKDFYCRAYAIAVYYSESNTEAVKFLESCKKDTDNYTNRLLKRISENSADALLP